MSIQAVSYVLEQDIPPAPKLVMVSIANYADRLGRGSHPSQETIALETSMGERTVRRWIGWLVDQGHLTRRRRGAPGGLGRSSDEYEIVGMAAAVAQPEPATSAGSDRGAGGTSTGQSGQPNRPNRAAEPATGGRESGLIRSEPVEEEGGVATYQAVLAALPADDRLRLEADVSADRLVRTLAQLEAHGWPPTAAATALTANPLTSARGRPVDSIARTLATRADRIVQLPPPAPVTSDRPADDCGMCFGSGWIAQPGAGGDVDPCLCRGAA